MSVLVKSILIVSHVLIFSYGFLLQRNDSELSDINAIGFSIYCSRGAALCLAFDMVLIMIPGCRKLLSYLARFSHRVFGLGSGTVAEGTHSSTIQYHKYVGLSIAIFTAIHVLGHLVNFHRLEQLGRASAWSLHFGSWAGITGWGMLTMLSLMWITSRKSVRDKKFEVFWYTHHLALAILGLLIFHGYGCFVKTNDGVCRGYRSWRFLVAISAVYLLERLIRATESKKYIRLTSATASPGGVIDLTFSRSHMNYQPGQHLYLNVPTVSTLEWHPFTITSSPIESLISLDIRQDGDWTCQLGEMLRQGSQDEHVYTERGHGREHVARRNSRNMTPTTPTARRVVHGTSSLPLIRVDGPYGGPRADVLDFDHAILIGTGNGITTFSGILRHIWFSHQKTQNSRLRTLDLYWVSRDPKKLERFQALFSMDKTMELYKTGLIRIHIYFTSTPPPSSRSSSSTPRTRKPRTLSWPPPSRGSGDEAHLPSHSTVAAATSNSTRGRVLSNSSDNDLASTSHTILSLGIFEESSSSSRPEAEPPLVGSRYSDEDHFGDADEESHGLLASQSPITVKKQQPSTIPNGNHNRYPPTIPLRSMSAGVSFAPLPPRIATQTVSSTGSQRHLDESEEDVIGEENIHYGRPDFTELFMAHKEQLLANQENELGNDSILQSSSASMASLPRDRQQATMVEDDETTDGEGAINLVDENVGNRQRASALVSTTKLVASRQQRLKSRWRKSPVKVGVFYCGTPGLASSLNETCWQASDSRVRFSFVEAH